jgi:hypothetical protein
MKSLRLILTGVLFLGHVSSAAIRSSEASDEPTYTSAQVRAIIIQALHAMKPPIADIYYYDLYQWELTSHEVQDIRYIGNREWEVVSHAFFDGYHKGLSVGRDICSLRWQFRETSGKVELLGNELLPPEGAPAVFSWSQVIAIVAKHMSDMYSDHAPLNWHDTAHYKLNYLGDGRWEVRVVITNAVGLWHFDENSRVVEFQGRLGP